MLIQQYLRIMQLYEVFLGLQLFYIMPQETKIQFKALWIFYFILVFPFKLVSYLKIFKMLLHCAVRKFTSFNWAQVTDQFIRLQFMQCCQYRKLFFAKSMLMNCLGFYYMWKLVWLLRTPPTCSHQNEAFIMLVYFYFLYRISAIQESRLQILSKKVGQKVNILFYANYLTYQISFLLVCYTLSHIQLGFYQDVLLIYFVFYLTFISPSYILSFSELTAMTCWLTYRVITRISKQYYGQIFISLKILFIISLVLFLFFKLTYELIAIKEQSQSLKQMILRIFGLTKSNNQINFHYQVDEQFAKQQKIFNWHRMQIKIIGKRIKMSSLQQVCSICLTSLNHQNESSQILIDQITLRCGHYYHQNCIKKWVKYGRMKCPCVGLRLRQKST